MIVTQGMQAPMRDYFQAGIIRVIGESVCRYCLFVVAKRLRVSLVKACCSEGGSQ